MSEAEQRDSLAKAAAVKLNAAALEIIKDLAAAVPSTAAPSIDHRALAIAITHVETAALWLEASVRRKAT